MRREPTESCVVVGLLLLRDGGRRLASAAKRLIGPLWPCGKPVLVAKRHQRASGYGMAPVAYLLDNRMGLIDLHGLVVTLRPNRAWRG